MAVYVSNIVINTGTTFAQTFTLENVNTNSVVDLTNYTIKSEMRKHPGSTTGVTTFTSSIASAAGGQIQIGLSTTQTAALKPGRYVYDVLLTDNSGTRDRVVEGMVIVSQGATR
jgi:hypothetical protein